MKISNCANFSVLQYHALNYSFMIYDTKPYKKIRKAICPICFSEDIHNSNLNIKKEADYDLLYRLYGSANLLLIPFISSETVLSKILA